MKNNTQSQITLIASFSRDTLLNRDRIVIREQQGGPAYFCGNALKMANITYSLITGSIIRVKIIVADNWELGKISQKINPKTINLSKIKTKYIFFNPIIEEFKLINMPDYKGKIFIDVQGLVRDKNDFGKKKEWNPSSDYEEVFCLKATEEELTYINNRFINSQKKRVLIITKGNRGTDMFVSGKKYSFPIVETVKNLPDTIGAGDTFLANFLLGFIWTQNPLESIKIASEKTTEFLKSKLHHS